MFLPECLDDHADGNNLVTAIDAFAERRELAALGFGAPPAATGRPGCPYRPGRRSSGFQI